MEWFVILVLGIMTTPTGNGRPIEVAAHDDAGSERGRVEVKAVSLSHQTGRFERSAGSLGSQ